jgi:predicted transcriptional regulator
MTRRNMERASGPCLDENYYVRSMCRVTELGPLEMRVLGLLDPSAPRSVAEVREMLARQGTDVAYTTVMTVLARLHDKRVVVRAKDGNRYLYRQAARVPQVKAGVIARLRSALFQSDRLRPIAELVENDLSREELASLRELIDARLKESKR